MIKWFPSRIWRTHGRSRIQDYELVDMNGTVHRPTAAELNTLLEPCRQCGQCCRRYRRVRLEKSEVAFIRKMGGYVGVDIHIRELRSHSLQELRDEAEKKGRIYMIHPDGQGCVFLQKRNGKYFCRIYSYRPRACRGFRCTFADPELFEMLCADAGALLIP